MTKESTYKNRILALERRIDKLKAENLLLEDRVKRLEIDVEYHRSAAQREVDKRHRKRLGEMHRVGEGESAFIDRGKAR